MLILKKLFIKIIKLYHYDLIIKIIHNVEMPIFKNFIFKWNFADSIYNYHNSNKKRKSKICAYKEGIQGHVETMKNWEEKYSEKKKNWQILVCNNHSNFMKLNKTKPKKKKEKKRHLQKKMKIKLKLKRK